MTRIALASATIATLMLADMRPSEAYYEGRWCAYMSAGRDFYTSRCDLPNYEACRAEMNAAPGTWCTQNPRYVGPPEQPARLSKSKKRQTAY